MIKVFCDMCGKEVNKKNFDTRTTPLDYACRLKVKCDSYHCNFEDTVHLCMDCQKLVEKHLNVMFRGGKQ